MGLAPAPTGRTAIPTSARPRPLVGFIAARSNTLRQLTSQGNSSCWTVNDPSLLQKTTVRSCEKISATVPSQFLQWSTLPAWAFTVYGCSCRDGASGDKSVAGRPRRPELMGRQFVTSRPATGSPATCTVPPHQYLQEATDELRRPAGRPTAIWQEGERSRASHSWRCSALSRSLPIHSTTTVWVLWWCVGTACKL
jgi:hypothetical protein